ncbi:quinone oxidoreductase family protein [Shouchella shacheensis]|uniref:quinone oxidoreductase family protein n=1 Tax=Shouchella shacheensis TaxID=1649580 RepID=UPI0007404C5A|nr:zinc-binding dehydrogenase [Shouchella shacheensis]
MKSVIIDHFGGPEVLKIKETDIPKISSTDVLIRVEKTSVNFADVKQRNGRKGKGDFPITPGLDAAGTIERVGEHVKGLRVGQRVIAFPNNGSYAEYVVAKEALTFALPDNIDFTSAAACPTVSFLSYKLLHDVARLRNGETILVHAAAGGVGTTVIQLAKLLGAGKVIGTVSEESKFSVVQEAGADHVILYKDFPCKVNKLTDGLGVNIVLDSLSGKVSEQSMSCLSLYGRLVHFGDSSEEVGIFETKELHSSCRSVLGFSLGTTRKERPDLLKGAADQVFKYMSEGKLMIKIGMEFSLEDACEAHKLLESRKSTGKILLSVRE